jgi:hypothetical protein
VFADRQIVSTLKGSKSGFFDVPSRKLFRYGIVSKLVFSGETGRASQGVRLSR